MEDPNSSIFSYAKLEYTNQLIDTLSPHIFDGVKSVYDEAKKTYSKENSKSTLLFFRLFLEKVPTWSNEIIETETNRIIEASCCDWLDDLITAVFISHTKILTSIGSNHNANVDLTIPKTVNFIHKCYINIAREIWKNPYLYNENINGTDYQVNMRTIETIIKEGIENSIRRLLPIKEILKQHLVTYESNNQEIQKKKLTTDFKELLLNELKELNLVNTLGKSRHSTKEIHENTEDINEDNDNGENSDNGDNDNDNDNGDISNEEISDNEEITDNEEINEGISNIISTPQTTNHDYDSPDEDTIQRNCENIEINDIPDVTTDYNVSSIKEEIYDNVDLATENKANDPKTDLLNTFIQNLPEKKKIPLIITKEPLRITKEPLTITKEPLRITKEPLTITKEPEKEPEPAKNILLNNPDPFKDPLLNKKINLEGIPENKEVKIVGEDKKSVLREVISVQKIDNSDNETVDDFFNDVTRLLEEKGEKINKNAGGYTLFDDADENE
jgi:hypothetical protein